MTRYALGIDFGTESARTVLASVDDGTIRATAVRPYTHGVIDRSLPTGGEQLPPDWALQNPSDWLTALAEGVGQVLAQSQVAPEQVVGIGIDLTACTVLPTLADGTPLCEVERYRREPHAYAKLWKHHAAQPQADRLNALAAARGEPWLPRHGGKISSEWLAPKALQILEEAPTVYADVARIVEGADWVVWQLTGALARNACTAGYKAIWHKHDGFPSPAFLTALHPGLTDLYTRRVAGPVVAPGANVGGLTAPWAERLGLPAGTPVAAALIDAHAAVLGGGVSTPGVLYMMMGTSTCHLLLAETEVLAEGISGVVEDGIVPGLYAYEAGQASVGDIFAWFVRYGVPPRYHEQAARDGRSLHALLAELAGRLRPGESGLLALDWWNGCRTPLVDAGLSGVVLGYDLHTPPEAIYRALIEATAFGTRLVVETFTRAGLPVGGLRAGGGLTANPALVQIYADVAGLPLEVSGTDQASALGAAMLGAVAGGAFPTVEAAVQAMAPPPARTVAPVAAHHAIYDELYAEYLRLVDYFGRAADTPLKRLRELRARAGGLGAP